MKINLNAQEIIAKVENSTSGLPKEILINEALITIEKDEKKVQFRLREFNKKASQQHLKMMKAISNNQQLEKGQLDEIENFGRAFTVADLTEEEFKSVAKIYNEVINYFKK